MLRSGKSRRAAELFPPLMVDTFTPSAKFAIGFLICLEVLKCRIDGRKVEPRNLLSLNLAENLWPRQIESFFKRRQSVRMELKKDNYNSLWQVNDFLRQELQSLKDLNPGIKDVFLQKIKILERCVGSNNKTEYPEHWFSTLQIKSSGKKYVFPGMQDFMEQQSAEVPQSCFLPRIPDHLATFLRTRFGGIDYSDVMRERCGCFPVVRKARGVRTSDVEDVNIIVRDLLWVRPHTSKDDVLESQSYAPGSSLGFYISCLDGQVYEIKKIVYRQHLMMIDAVAHLDNRASKSACFYFPIHDATSHIKVSFGSMMGNLRNTDNYERTGCWTAILLRPIAGASDVEQIDADLIVFAEYLEGLGQKSDEKHYGHKVLGVLEYAEQLGLIGVLSSQMLSLTEDETARQQSIESQTAFDSLLEPSEIFKQSVKKNIEREIEGSAYQDMSPSDILLDFALKSQNLLVSPIEASQKKILSREVANIERHVSILSPDLRRPSQTYTSYKQRVLTQMSKP